MSDRCVLFDVELAKAPQLRTRTYEVHGQCEEDSVVCIELSGRQDEDWFFARRWVNVQHGRRLLHWLLDEAEAQGFRFKVTKKKPQKQESEIWMSSQLQWASLSAEEKRIHKDLFPEEDDLIGLGYDWDAQGVRMPDGTHLPADELGRVFEPSQHLTYEWVKIPDEFTWRRYPLALSPSIPLPVSKQGEEQ